MTIKKRIFSLFMALAFVILMLPSFDLKISAANATYDSGAVVINSLTHADGDTITILQGVYSVTVDSVDVNIIFGSYDSATGMQTGVTIDRTTDGFGDLATTGAATADGLYKAGEKLGWRRDNGGYYVPTAPFLITGDANVNALFYGTCVFKAGTNGVYIAENSSKIGYDYTKNYYRGGYAGIQVDGNASLTITNANHLSAYGAYQNISDPSKAAANGDAPTGSGNDDALGGGAGIGGGAPYKPEHSGLSTYTNGTPGNITILNGKIFARGGHLAAGIGGGHNSAATTGTIAIIGGDITVQGGRWAAGIGEGDSYSAGTSDLFWNHDYEIIIGGDTSKSLKLHVTGGYCSAGIGTTDEISSKSMNMSGLSITIYSGEVTATSGLGNAASAAIGAGDDTDMKANSIEIYADAYISAASFSQYAITNYGMNPANLPAVNLDPSSYMYLARFPNGVSEAARTFTLYAVKHNADGYPILVNDTSANIADENWSASEHKFYAYDHYSGQFYYTDDEGNYLDGEGASSDEKVAATITEELSYYFDTSKVIKTYEVPASYKAIALTLPDPSVYGGAYVLHAPQAAKDTGNVTRDVYSVIKKYSAGVNSGEVIYESAYHYSKQDDGSYKETPNMSEDAVALPLESLRFGISGDPYGKVTSDMIENFSSGTYGYTVYIPEETEQFYMDFSYDYENVTSITVDIADLNLEHGDITILPESTDDTSETIPGQTEYHLGDGLPHGYIFSMPEGQTKANIWIRKNDVAEGGTSPYIVYRIEVIIKPMRGLELTDLSKTYDKAPVNPSTQYMTEETAGFHFSVTDTADTPGEGYNITSTPAIESMALKLIENQSLQFTGKVWVSSGWWGWYENVTVVITVNTTVQRIGDIVQVTTTFSHEEDEDTTHTRVVVTDINFATGEITYEGDDTHATITELNIEIDVGHSDDYAYVRLIDNNNNAAKYRIWTMNRDGGGSDTTGDATQRAEAIEKAKVMAAKELGHQSGKTITGTYQYDKGEKTLNTTLTFTGSAVTFNDINNDNDTTKEVVSLTGSGNVRGNFIYEAYISDGGAMIALSKEDRGKIQYTFYEYDDLDKDGMFDEGETLTAIAEAPMDAGTYVVRAELNTTTYEAKGEKAFRISKRPVTIMGIEHWLTYLEQNQMESLHAPYPIADTGAIYFDEGLINGDTLILNPAIEIFYNEVSICYSPTKITLKLSQSETVTDVTDWLPKKEDTANHNYYIANITKTNNDAETQCTIPGEIAYKITSAVFRKTENKPWRKFWPSWSKEPLSWTDYNDEGISTTPVSNQDNIDYRSPDNVTHQTLVTLRTVNNGAEEKRYAVDIIVGDMYFTYSEEVWDVNSHQYVSTDGSIWSGNDGVNNRIQIVNHSNQDVTYTIELELREFYGEGIYASLSDVYYDHKKDPNGGYVTGDSGRIDWDQTQLSSADDADGVDWKVTKYLYLDGVPQSSAPADGLGNGSITITISPASGA